MNHRRRPAATIARVLPVLLLLVLVFFLTAHAFARAGGGEDFGGGGDGGGGGGFGGGGGGGGGGGLIYLVIDLLINYPAIGIPVLLCVVVFFFLSSHSGVNAYQSSVIRRGGDVIDTNSKLAVIGELRQHDPNFDEAAFCNRVRDAFMKIQQAWCAQNLDAVQIFISDGVAERFALQFLEQKQSGYRDHMEQIGIDDVRIADINCAGVFDEIAARISARSADYHVSLANNQRMGGSGVVEPFVEIWSFLRRRGVLTDVTKSGLIEGHCPNCGAAVTMNETGKCPNCKSLLRSGQYDWILTEITQESEWDPNQRHQVPGLEEFRQRDPGFDPEILEDRTSVIFWRKAAADRAGKIDPLRKVAAEEFCKAYQPLLQPTPSGQRLFAGECAVGGVTTLAIRQADDPSQLDQALVQVRWSGSKMMAAADGPPRNLGDKIIHTSNFLLGRKSGVKTDAEKGLASGHCPNCGAPESSAVDNACEFCGTVLNDGSTGWILLRIGSPGDQVSQSLLQSARAGGEGLPPLPLTAPAGHGSPSGLLAWAVQTAASSGGIDQSDRKLFADFAASVGVSNEDLNAMIDAAERGNLTVPQPASAQEASAWMTAIAKVALEDGTLDQSEYTLLRALGAKVGMGDEDIRLLLRRVQSDHYAAASQALRASKA
jgi:hypothetical protein